MMLGKKTFKTTKSRRTTVRVVLTAIMAPPVVYTLYMGVMAYLDHDFNSFWFALSLAAIGCAAILGIMQVLIVLFEWIQDWINSGV